MGVMSLSASLHFCAVKRADDFLAWLRRERPACWWSSRPVHATIERAARHSKIYISAARRNPRPCMIDADVDCYQLSGLKNLANLRPLVISHVCHYLYVCTLCIFRICTVDLSSDGNKYVSWGQFYDSTTFNLWFI